MLFFICLIIACIIYSLFINRILRLPRGPPPLPVIGNMLSFSWDMDNKFLEWKEKYGTIFTVWIPFPVVVYGDHKVLHEQIIKNGDVYMGRRNPEQLMDLMNGGLYGLVFEDNTIVKEQRRFALRSLHDVGFGSSHLEDTVYGYTQEVISRWKSQSGKEIDVTENIMNATGNIIWTINFGINLAFDDPFLSEFRELQQEFLPIMAGPLMQFIEFFPFLRKMDFLFGYQIKKLSDCFIKVNKIMREAIETTRNSFSSDDRPGSYIEAFLSEMKRREENGLNKGSFIEQQMVSAAFTIWGAGFDTTVTVLRASIHYLINNPNVQRKLHDEIDTKIGKRRIRFEDSKNLPYCSAFMQEMYRTTNVLPLNFFRKVLEDTVVEGHEIPEGTTILPQYSMVHMDPKEFERPDYFCPERHLNAQGEFVKDPRITPFSMGKRSCIGESLARMEIFVMFCSYVQHLSFHSVSVIPPKLEFIPGFSRTPKPFTAIVKSRD